MVPPPRVVGPIGYGACPSHYTHAWSTRFVPHWQIATPWVPGAKFSLYRHFLKSILIETDSPIWGLLVCKTTKSLTLIYHQLQCNFRVFTHSPPTAVNHMAPIYVLLWADARRQVRKRFQPITASEISISSCLSILSVHAFAFLLR